MFIVLDSASDAETEGQYSPDCAAIKKSGPFEAAPNSATPVLAVPVALVLACGLLAGTLGLPLTAAASVLQITRHSPWAG